MSKTQRKIAKALEELTPEEIAECHRLYFYTSTPIREIQKKFHLKIDPGQFARLFPDEPSGIFCPYCDIEMLQFKKRSGSEEPYCPSCKHRYYELGATACSCRNCSNVIKFHLLTILDTKPDRIKAFWIDHPEKISVSTLFPRHRVLLGIFLNCTESITKEGADIIINPSASTTQCFPNDEEMGHFIEELIRYKVLYLFPEVNHAPYSSISADALTILNYKKHRYVINVQDDSSLSLADIANGHFLLPQKDFVNLWRWISEQHVICYLKGKLNKSSFQKAISNEMANTIKHMLERCAVIRCMQYIRVAFMFCFDRYNEGASSHETIKLLPKECHKLCDSKKEIRAFQCKIDSYNSIAEEYILNKLFGMGLSIYTHEPSEIQNIYKRYSEAFYENNEKL